MLKRKQRQRKQHKKKKIGIFTVNLLICLCACPVTTYAYDTIYQDILINYKDYFVNNSIIKDAFRYIQWGLITLLHWMADGAQNLYSSTLGLIDFTQYAGVTDFTDSLQDMFTIIMVLSLTCLGLLMIINHKKLPNIIHSLLLAAFTISALSSVMITANTAVIAFCGDMVSDSVGDEVVNANLIDLYYVDMYCGGLTSFSDDEETLATYHYDIANFDIEAININETMNYKNEFLSEDAKELISKQASLLPNGTVQESEVYNGWGWNSTGDSDWFNEFYYRYHMKPFPICVSLIAVLIAYLCVSYKTARLIWELAIKKILALLYSADVTGTQKTIKILGNIKDTYCMLMFTAIILKVFSLFNVWLSANYSNDGFTYCMILLFVSMAVIDGPNIIQQLTGEDAGLQSGFGKMVAIASGARGVARGVTGHASNGIRSVVAAKRHHDIKSALGTSKKSKANLNSGQAAVGGSGGKNKDISNAMNDKDNLNKPNNNPNNNPKNDPLRAEKPGNKPESIGKANSAKAGNDELRAAMKGNNTDNKQSIDNAVARSPEGNNEDIAAATKDNSEQSKINPNLGAATEQSSSGKNLPPKSGGSQPLTAKNQKDKPNISSKASGSSGQKKNISSQTKNVSDKGSSKTTEKEKMNQINSKDNLK